MARKAKLAPGSLLTVDDQVRLYEEQMGEAATERQTKAADRKAERCTCTPTTVKRHWQGSEKAHSRRVHHPACPKWRGWMEEVRSSTRWAAS